MPRKAISFASFQASGRDVADLRAVLPDMYERRTPGRVYTGDLVIEDTRGNADGAWMLTIGNSSRCSNDLKSLERELFDYGIDEGHIDAPRAAQDSTGQPVPRHTSRMDHHAMIVASLRQAADAKEQRFSEVPRADLADFCHEIRAAREFATQIEGGEVYVQLHRRDVTRPANDPQNFTDLINVLRDIQDLWPGLDRFLGRTEEVLMRLDPETLIHLRSHLMGAQMRINQALDGSLKAAMRRERDRPREPGPGPIATKRAAPSAKSRRKHAKAS